MDENILKNSLLFLKQQQHHQQQQPRNQIKNDTSVQVAQKLRKIKENLELNYQNQSVVDYDSRMSSLRLSKNSSLTSNEFLPASENSMLTPPDSLCFTTEEANEIRRRNLLKKHTSIYSQDSLNSQKSSQSNNRHQQQQNQAIYIDNLSRQSSIRSLISNDRKTNEINEKKQQHQQQRQQKSSNHRLSMPDFDSNSQYGDFDEKYLILNWEQFDVASTVSGESTNRLVPHKRMSNERRCETRMGFRVDEKFETESESVVDSTYNDENTSTVHHEPIRRIDPNLHKTQSLSHQKPQSSFKTDTLNRSLNDALSSVDMQQLSVDDFNLEEIKFAQNNYFNGHEPQTTNRQHYKVLSTSINKLFNELHDHFEHSKALDESLTIKSNHTTPHNKQQYESLSNKDSGFNQSPQQSKPNSINQAQMKEQIIMKKKNAKNNLHLVSKTSDEHEQQTTLFKNNQKDLSILDRYLNNDEQIGYKYRRIIHLLERVFCENGYLLDDYSLSEYIVNQEGISFATFSQSIREKYQDFEWNDMLLRELHEIINEQSYQQQQQQQQQLETSVSSSQGNKSFRKLKDIKYASQQKKKQNSSSLNNNESFTSSQTPTLTTSEIPKHLSQAGILMQPNNWKQEIESYFNNTPIIRRERKGSLPEIKLNRTVQKDSSTSDTQKTQQGNNFVLEVLRTSMFRSKSATDLNNLVKSTSAKSIDFDVDVCDVDDESLNTNSNKTSLRIHPNHCTKCLKGHSSIDDSFRGLIWQCANMCYQEFINKYSELKWLLDGGTYSIQSKLREVEQRLSIDLKLYSNNKRFYLGTMQDIHKKDSDAIQQRLMKQLNSLREKINELKSLRLYLLLCEANTKSLETSALKATFDALFNITPSQENNLKSERTLQGKSISNLLFSLYSFDALRNGFVYQFYVVYRYFFSSSQLLEFFVETFRQALRMPSGETSGILLARTIDLIKMWIDGFYVIDFQRDDSLFINMEIFLDSDIGTYSRDQSKILMTLLHNPSLEFKTFAFNSTRYKLKLKKKLFGFLKSPLSPTSYTTRSSFKTQHDSLSESAQSRSQSTFTDHADTMSETFNDVLIPYETKLSKSILCMNKKSGSYSINDIYLPKISRKIDSFSLDDYPIFTLAAQLTLIEWDNFLDIHPCHCLNSKSQGIHIDAKAPINTNNIFNQQSLFIDTYLSKSIYKMIQFNYQLTHWVSAEVLSARNLKCQVTVITKFLSIAKLCCDWSNFSTAICIYDGLQELVVKQLPAWKQVSSKTIHTLDTIASLKLLLQNEPLLLRRICQTTNMPSIPYMHLFLLLVQQHEHGSFQLVNGLWKWSKLSFLATLVDQIRIIQQHYVYRFQKLDDLADFLLQRIDSFKNLDLNLLAESNQSNFYNPKLVTPTSNAGSNNNKRKSISNQSSMRSAITTTRDYS